MLSRSQCTWKGRTVETAGVILAIAVIAGISILGSYLRKQATRALNRGVFERGHHARGQNSTKEHIEFTAPVPAAEVTQTVRARLNLPYAAPGAFIAQLWLAQDEPGILTFAFGNKLAETFRSVLMVEDTPSGSKATYTVLTWVEGDGIVRGIPEMELLANTIRTCAAELGGVYGTAPVVSRSLPDAAAPGVAEPQQANAKFCTDCGSELVGSRFCTDCGAVLA